MEVILLSREDKQEELLHTQGGGLSLKEKEERPPTVSSLYVCSFFGKLLVWGNKEWKNGINFNRYKVYFVVSFSFMVWLSDNVWVSRY